MLGMITRNVLDRDARTFFDLFRDDRDVCDYCTYRESNLCEYCFYKRKRVPTFI